MSISPSRCELYSRFTPHCPNSKSGSADHTYRFVDCEKWRKETKLDEILPTWDYPEKAEIFKYYPQYYHKTDKVGPSFRLVGDYGLYAPLTDSSDTTGRPASLH